MIDRKISVSEQVAGLPVEAQLIFSWSIPHSDDVGMLPRPYRTLKALIVPMWDCTVDQFSDWVDKIVEADLWREVAHNGKQYFVLTKFREHQTLKRDRQPQTILDFQPSATFKESWERLSEVMETFGIHLETAGIQMEPEVKEEKGRKEVIKKGVKKFVKPTVEQVAAYCKERGNRINAQRFVNHYESNGWKVGKNPMKDWKAAVRTWEQNDFNRSGGTGGVPAKTGKYAGVGR